MVKVTEQKKRQKTLIIVLIVVVVMAIVVWYLGLQGEVPAEGEVSAGVSPTEEMLKEIRLDFSVFDSPLFKSLKSHGILPVTAGETGRENPFSPY